MVKVRNEQKANDELIIEKAKIKKTGNITELIGYLSGHSEAQIVRLNTDEYMVKSSGEVKEYQHSENRSQNLKNVRVTIRTLRDIINSNVRDPEACKWVTLTYAENMMDPKRLHRDFVVFWKRFVRWCKKNGISVPDYINVVEPQARGAWHCHLIMIWSCKAPFVPNADIEKLWGHGFTKTKALNNVDNIGAYFSAYLADMPLDELEDDTYTKEQIMQASFEVVEREISDDEGNKKRKKFVKGARLYLYPPGMNLYRTSRNIKRPIETEIEKETYFDIVNTYSDGKEKSQLGPLTFSSNSVVIAADGKIINSINRYYFNTKSELNGDAKK